VDERESFVATPAAGATAARKQPRIASAGNDEKEHCGNAFRMRDRGLATGANRTHASGQTGSFEQPPNGSNAQFGPQGSADGSDAATHGQEQPTVENNAISAR